METEREADMADLLHTPSPGAHVLKIMKQNITMEGLLEAIQARHLRFDTQGKKMGEMNTKYTQNTVMISSLAKAPQVIVTKDCKEKITALALKVSVLRKKFMSSKLTRET
ncbi:hypothetical protein GOODEAATRI_011237 [Goodea atripinnis]|uniref:Uncharacterized protein n=1 Tax=Goodea atripinnis TaxID=208336 RepID=A0ABV0N9P9_9TELE